MKSLKNTLFFSLLVQVCLAAAIFGTAEEGPIAFITLPLALFSCVAIDLLGWVRIPRLMLNAASLGAVGLAIAEFRQQGESRLLAGGHLIVYLTWSFLLQVKDLRRMWWLFALSILQVSVGAVLTTQPWFGAALFLYIIMSIWTMSLLSLARAALLTDPNLLNSANDEEVFGPEIEGPDASRSFAQDSVRTDEQGRWLSPRFILGGIMTFVLSLALGVVFFILTPRVWIGPINLMADGNSGSAKTGFSETVNLGETAQLMESNELVMEVEFTDQSTGQPMTELEVTQAFGPEPLFRGKCLEIYDAEYKSWQSLERTRVHPTGYSRRAPYEAHIRLQPLDSQTLFYPGTLWAAYETSPEGRSKANHFTLIVHEWTQSLMRRNSAALVNPIAYTAEVLPVNTVLNPAFRESDRQMILKNGFDYQWRYLLFSPSPRITDLAQQVVNQHGLDPRGEAESTARALENYLQTSPEYDYSLNLSVTDPKIDPIEDFVFNRKKGHCEYFASALALMLRGVGIPSRLVNGFKGGEFNKKSGLYEIRALHAHAWVEAYVDGAWVNFDPTPATRDEQISAKENDKPNPIVDSTKTMWFQGMNYSKSQQEKMVYAPIRGLVDWGRNQFSGMMDGSILQQVFQDSPSGGSLAGLAVPVRVGIFLAAIVSGLIAIGILGKWAVRAVRRRLREREESARRAITVEFYARFMKLMQDHGLPDIPTQTAREFAVTAEQRFAAKWVHAGNSGRASRLAELFYAVRFGGMALSTEQLSETERELSALETSLTRTTVA